MTSTTIPTRWTRYDLIGPDAADFLQRLSTVKISALSTQTQPGCFLSATGKIRAYFWITKTGPQSFALEFDAGKTGGWEKSFLAFIDQFKFAERFEVQKHAGPCAWIFNHPNSTSGSFSHGTVDFGLDWLTHWGAPEIALPQDLEKRRILLCRPWFDREITEDTNPLEVGLTDAIARGKGCFPGQEVTERIFTYGAPPRRLVLVRGTVRDNGSPPAGLTSQLVLDDSTYIGLTLVSKTLAKEGTEIPQGVIEKCAPFSA